MAPSISPIRLLAVLLLLICVAGCGVDAVRMNQQAQIYMNHGEYEKAEEILVNSFDTDHENPASHYWLGRCYEQMGFQEKAIYQYGLAIRFTPSLDVAQMAYIKLLYQNGQIEEATQAALNYLEHKDEPARDLVFIAESFTADQMPDLAIMSYRQAQKNEPDNPWPWIKMAEFYLAQQQKPQAVDALKQAFQIDPVYPDLARQLGAHGYRVNIPQPRIHPLPPTPLQRELEERNL